jgi:hypothetical protein
MSAIGNRDVDREYWLAHCEGFQVLAGKRRIGFVQDVVDGGRTLVVRGGLLGRRIVSIPADDVYAVVPRDLRVWLTSSATVRAPRVDSVLAGEPPAVAQVGLTPAERIAA